MTGKTLIGEFHNDHTKVVSALMKLRSAIQDGDVDAVRGVLEAADRLVGPHFKFEELYLYPRLKEFLGEGRVQRLLTEHDGVFRGVGALVNLARKTSWEEADTEIAAANLDLIWEHPVTCDGLSLYIERLPQATQEELLERMEETRREGTLLLAYRRERLN